MAPVNELLGSIGKVLNGLPDVFSTAQWGGRAYKLPGANGSLKKPRLVAYVAVTKDESAVAVVFKLPKEASAEATRRFEWIGPFKFGSWEKSGWVEARVSDGRQVRTLARLLRECRAMFPAMETSSLDELRGRTSAGAPSNPVVKRIDRVMAEAKAGGWKPPGPRSKP